MKQTLVDMSLSFHLTPSHLNIGKGWSQDLCFIAQMYYH